MPAKYRFTDSVTGMRVSKAYAEANKSTTQSHLIKKMPRRKYPEDWEAVRPHLDDVATPEPSVYEIVRRFYRAAYPKEVADSLTDKYFAALTAQS